MSTEGQQYSIPRQQAAIREYADRHGLMVVRTYADPGKSGLRLKNRPGLIQLLDDVQHGAPDFDVILVYDVSRWGRFQDTDESGFYEYLCRRSGVRVEYCVELFENDGGPLSAILKNIKRVMAAEYSRERSHTIHRAVCQTAARGHFAGGSPTYGLRRRLVSSALGPGQILERGEHRALRQDYVVLTPGPADEVRTVRRIFRLFVELRLSPRAIAERLNHEGKTNRVGGRWRTGNIHFILQNERYIGTQMHNRTSKGRLSGRPGRVNDPSVWVRKPNAFPAIVPKSIFNAAQAIRARRTHRQHTTEALLERLRYLWRTHGYLSVALINRERPEMPSYRRRFGGILKAYELIGYVQNRGRPQTDASVRLARVAQSMRDVISAQVRVAGHSISYDRQKHFLCIDGATTLLVKTVTCWPTKRARKRWRLCLQRTVQPTYTLLALLDETNEQADALVLLPRGKVRPIQMRIGDEYVLRNRHYRCSSLDDVALRVLAGGA
jgi:DNA invertase Pin-like site-specific DNA recombinase